MAWRPELLNRVRRLRPPRQPAPAATHEILAALTYAHRQELSEAHALIVRYRYVLEEHGITPPDDTGKEALDRFRHAFQMAGMYDSMQHPELLAGPWRTNIRAVA